MKKLSFILALGLCSVARPNNPVKSEVKSVTVYLSGAQITRTVQLTLEPGTNYYTIGSLSPVIDENTIQLAGLKNISLLSINYKVDYETSEEDDAEIKKLDLLLEELNIKMNLNESNLKGLDEEENILGNNRRVIFENQSASLEKIKEFGNYYRQRVTEINVSRYKAKHAIEKLLEEIEGLNRNKKQIEGKNKSSKGSIELKLESAFRQSATIEIKYKVDAAGWFPFYDVRANSNQNGLQLAMKANVYQQSGEFWPNCNIILSTADPSIKSEKPELTPHYLNFISKAQASKSSAPLAYKYNPTVKKVKGKILDSNGFPLPGASILVKGTSTGTQTDFDGNFNIDVANGSLLVVSYVGYITEEVPVYSSTINLNLQEDATTLEEVVVTGYGTSNALNGKVSGVSINHATGATPQVAIRGMASIKSSEKPLFIVDGAPVDDASFLDESEVETIQVLKDEAQTALYGNRGKNGVVLITTKTYREERSLEAIEYIINKPYSIKSNEDVTVIPIKTLELDVDLEHFTAPVLSENVYLVANLKNWEKHQLLPGEANLYFDSNFRGKSYINTLTEKTSLPISLGIDQNITVKRNQINSMKGKSFTGTYINIDKEYEIVLKNNSNKDITVTLYDRVPISQNKEIKVDNILHDADKIDESKKILSWSVRLKPAETSKKRLSYTVKYPKFKRVNL